MHLNNQLQFISKVLTKFSKAANAVFSYNIMMPARSHKLFVGWLLLQKSNKFFLCSEFVYFHLKEL